MNWKYVKLGTLCKTGAGGTPLKSKKEYYENGNVPWLRSGEVNNRNIEGCDIKITSKGLKESSAKLFPPRTVLIAMYGATAGQVGILNFECSTNQAVCGILPNENIIPEFIYYKFLEGKEALVKQAVGGAQPNISQIKIKNTLIPDIPLSEQKRIVSILDRAFEAIDKAKANAEQNLKNAKELFESYLQGVFENKGDDWEEKKFGELFKLKSGDGLTAKKMIDGQYPVFGGNGIAGYHCKYNYEDQIIIGRVGALCGNVRLVNKKFWLTDNAFRISQGLEYFINNFVVYMLNHKNLRNYARQAAQPVISNSSLKNVIINYPKSIEEQKQIVQKLDSLSSETKKLESIYQQKINDLEELKKSILQKAFAGELI